jgi:hypothetical protein
LAPEHTLPNDDPNALADNPFETPEQDALGRLIWGGSDVSDIGDPEF